VSDFVLRAAAPGDAAALAKLAHETFLATFGHLYPQSDVDAFTREVYAPDAWGQAIADVAIVCVLALKNETLVGYLKAGPLGLPYDPGARRAVELKNLYVTEAEKGRGVAHALMDWTLDWAVHERNADDLYLGVYSDNLRAQRFYKRYGFDKVGEYFFPVGGTRDREFIMRKRMR
jgi:ribosomal protein S18 acetylase RimI-like enzyme